MPTESTASCNAMKILTHDEFAAKHPHPPSPVQMPKIDVARLNALRPKPKPSEYPPEPVRTPSDDGEDPVEEDRVPTGRTLRRRNEKVAKHLKREANEKEKENFRKRVFRIPLNKPFEEAYYTHRFTIEINNTGKRVEVEKTGENRSQPIFLDSLNPESESPREKERSNIEEVAIDLEEEEEELEEDVEIDRQEGTNVDRPTTVNIDRHTGNNVDRCSAPAEPAVERVYWTLPPFPPKKTQTKRELDKAICKKAFDKITLEMP
ncbi:hypothetical protein F2Q69_00012748 [Brassica cretica]|uniref:Uncharacterized protein n=1 Tax=Brassica cretica TaxID=69181 RepID=A0A8S9QPA5_BRACR|nr:hypothetical protein F2Q69_00012748 [Brassica cretica]